MWYTYKLAAVARGDKRVDALKVIDMITRVPKARKLDIIIKTE